VYKNVIYGKGESYIMVKAFFKKMAGISLVWQVTIVFSLIMIIPAVVITNSYFNIVRNSLLEEANKRVQEDLKRMNASMDTNIANMNDALNQMLFSQEFYYYLNPDNTLSNHEKNYYVSSVQNELLNIKYVYPNKFSCLIIYSKNKQIDEYVNWSYHMDRLYNRDYYKELERSNKDRLYGNVRAYDSSMGNLVTYNELQKEEELVLPVYQKINDLKTKKLIGFIEIDMSLDKLVNSKDLINEKSGAKYLIFDRYGSLVYTSDASDKRKFTSLSFIEQSGVCEVNLGKETYLAAYEKQGDTRLTSVVLMDKNEILSSSSEVDKLLIFVAVLSVLSVVGFTYVAARIMFRKLREMDKMIGQIEAGKFSVRIKVNGFNEISRIADSFNRMAEKLQSVIVSMVEKEKEQKNAEMHALQAQINPHFLYNTLENMRMQCEIDEYYAMSDSLSALGDLLRYSVQWDSREVTLDEELSNIERYIKIMEMRFSDKLTYHLKCSDVLTKIKIPKFILQPLVENCFNHGFKNSLPPWKISIDIYQEGNKLIINVEDNGDGIKEEDLTRINDCINNNIPISDVKKSKNSIGITNVKQRIEMLCPAGSGLKVESKYGTGTKVTVMVIMDSVI
jgi:two-component system, sensor histidine kinase YesM